MKAVALAIVLTTPVFADVAVPQPVPPPKTWLDRCAARIDSAGTKAGFLAITKATVLPLLHEDGKPNSLRYVEYVTPRFSITIGQEPEQRPDQRWKYYNVDRWFRRFHNRFAKIEGEDGVFGTFRGAIDECLKMGDLK